MADHSQKAGAMRDDQVRKPLMVNGYAALEALKSLLDGRSSLPVWMEQQIVAPMTNEK